MSSDVCAARKYEIRYKICHVLSRDITILGGFLSLGGSARNVVLGYKNALLFALL